TTCNSSSNGPGTPPQLPCPDSSIAPDSPSPAPDHAARSIFCDTGKVPSSPTARLTRSDGPPAARAPAAGGRAATGEAVGLVGNETAGRAELSSAAAFASDVSPSPSTSTVTATAATTTIPIPPNSTPRFLRDVVDRATAVSLASVAPPPATSAPAVLSSAVLSSALCGSIGVLSATPRWPGHATRHTPATAYRVAVLESLLGRAQCTPTPVGNQPRGTESGNTDSTGTHDDPVATGVRRATTGRDTGRYIRVVVAVLVAAVTVVVLVVGLVVAAVVILVGQRLEIVGQ